MRCLILTTEKPWFKKHFREISRYTGIKSFTVRQLPVPPNVVFNPYFRWIELDWNSFPQSKHDVIALHMSHATRKKLGINKMLGLYRLDGNAQHEFFFSADKGLTDRRAKLNKFRSDFVWIFLHEFMHGLEFFEKQNDRTHAMDDQGRLKELYKLHNA